MDSIVSAFAMYNKNKKPQQNNKPKHNVKKKIRNNNLNNSLQLSEHFKKDVAQKLKQKKNKPSKNIKKKMLNKKKTLINKFDSKQTLKIKSDRKNISSDSENEIAPMLITAPQIYLNGKSNVDNDVGSISSHESIEFTPVLTDSAEEGLKVFQWMLSPHNPTDFLNKIWEKKPLLISRKKPNYYKDIISTPIIDNMLRNENIQFTKNIDVTSYTDGKRETHNPEGRAHPHTVWDFYLNGCSIRLLNPQTYIPKLHVVNATLQEFFNSFVGANAYLTPPDSQGFAPHYDDIEAFILQIEGKKHWRVYKPRSDNEELPRVSSKNFDQEEIGNPILEVTLEAGDLLYFPRGYIHQGVTVDGEHSLHITVSMYQKHSWADLFEKLVPAALQIAISENIELRKGLPFDIYDNFGLVNSDVNTPRKQEITELVNSLFDKIKTYLPIDGAVDQMSKNFQHDVLPPVLTDLEKAVTVFGDADVMSKNGKVINRVELGLETRIRLLRKNILRMVSEEEQIRLYYYVENSLEYHGNELSYLEIDEELAPAIETLITTYPEYVSVESLDITNDSDKLHLADTLWSRGLIMTEYPLENIDDD